MRKRQPHIPPKAFQHPNHLIEGLRRFREGAYAANRDTWKQLATEQHPSILFITCADSQIDPGLITQGGPGELFEVVQTLPAVAAWLGYAMTARRVHDAAHGLSSDRLRSLTEENILTQIANLRTYPAGTLTIHGWHCDIGGGLVYGWDESGRRFMPLADVPEARPGPEHAHPC